ncbi:hypothetical protein JAAARDRAFT_189472 [Jaapia argillacea MUCL 33604]|uniref:F-box domain-containing protein n=1 Tax=Jaapia argillacea MUCL 33604 TaxID=933084 RepID=A0A067Q546_9AGAM|nr:hypothetical protein JAAARDRAFT_189472 [Jaapia argillacea MUCL 33604]
MHHCLEISEILTKIFEKVDLSELPAIAVTCRSFHDPALDILWAVVTGLDDMITLMPADAWSEEVLLDGSSIVSFVRPLRPPDWTRFLSYASRVRHLILSGSPSLRNRARRETYQSLSLHRPIIALFPHLRELTWKSSEDEIIFVELFLCPSLVKAKVGAHGRIADDLVNHALHMIVHLAPHLTSLDIAELQTSSPTSLTISALSRSLTLRNLRLWLPSPLDFANISSLTCLEDLDVTIFIPKDDRRDQWTITRNADLDTAFPALRRLAMTIADLAVASEVTLAMQPHRLESIRTRLSNAPSAAILARFIEVLSTCCSPAFLRSVIIFTYTNAGPRTAEEMANGFIVPPSVFVPLLSFSRMVQMEVRTPLSFALENSALQAIAVAWPALKRLHLGTSGSPTISKVTLEGIVPFAVHCPNLSYLGIVLGHAGHAESSEVVSGRKLDVMDFGRSPISDAPSVAAFLSSLFDDITEWPHIDRARSLFDREEGWEQARTLFPLFAKVRKDERTHWEKMYSEAGARK